MLNKSISLSKQVNRLSMKHKLFFTWILAHLDDYGLIDNDPEVLKATVVPMVKEIGPTDIQEFIKLAQVPDDNGEILIHEFKDCLEFPGFTNHNTLSEEKRSKSKYSRVPRIPQENIGENNNTQNFPLQVRVGEERIGKDRLGEGTTLSNEDFFSMVEEKEEDFANFIDSLHESTGIPKDVAKREIKKFASYWTEPNSTKTKVKWQMEKTFEVKRRLSTWLSRAGNWSKPSSNKYQVGTA